MLDASVIVGILWGSLPAGLLEHLRHPLVHPCAPALADLEVVSALRLGLRRGMLGVERAREALVDFLQLPLRRFSHPELLPRVFDLRDFLSPYDASYVALAEALDCPLFTGDGGLATTVHERGLVEVVRV